MDYNTVVLYLNVEWKRREGVDKNETEPTVKYERAHMYAKDITCELTGRQLEYFADEPIEPVKSGYPDREAAAWTGHQHGPALCERHRDRPSPVSQRGSKDTFGNRF